MKKKLDLISVVLRCYCILCIGQVTFKGGRKLVLATCQSAPGSTVKGGCSGSLIFTVLSAPPLPPVHRVRGGGGGLFPNS
jgi:hypothetical protein